MNLDKLSKKLSVIFASIALISFGSFFTYLTAKNPERSTEGWIPTQATVVDVNIDTNLETMTTTYKVWIVYNDLSQSEHFMLYGLNQGYEVGDTIQIKYDPNEPTLFADIDAETINNPLFGYIGIGMIALGLIIPSVYIGINVHKKRTGNY